MTDVSETRMNVAALKRVDPYVKDILDTATHVALYTFNEDNSEWDKTEVEGALFVYSRNGEPYHSIVIMNRLSTENQVEPVTKDLDLQLQEPFLLYRNTKGRIYGIWFYDRDECVRITSMLNKLIKESENCTKNAAKAKQVQRPPNNVDIFSMLSKAQEDFNTNRQTGGQPVANNVSNNAGARSNSGSKSPNKSINERFGPLAAPLGPDVTSQSVMDFFAKAKVNTGHYKSRDQPTPGKAAVTPNDTKPLLLRLMSNPAAHLEHIEKQQRSTTPQPAQNTPLAVASPCVNVNNTANKSKKKNKATAQSENNSINPLISEDHQPVRMNAKHNDVVNSSLNDSLGSSGFHRIQSPIQNQNARINCNTSNSIPLSSLFSNTTDNTQLIEDNMSTPITSRQTSVSALELRTPMMFAPRSPGTESVNRNFESLNRSTTVEPLTRNQLLQAFNYLLRSDPDFVNKLHEAYVKSFSEILS